MKKENKSLNISNIFLSSWHPYGWIVFVVFLLFFKTLFFDLTHFDDEVWLIRYHWFLKDWSRALEAFFRPDFVTDFLYRPILTLSFMSDTIIYKASLWGYRLTNLNLHAINCCLVFFLFQRLKYDKALALSFSLIFTVHPLMTLAVGWIPGRTETLFAFFVLVSFIYFLYFLETDKKRYFFGHLLFFIFALFTKETAIVIPIAMMLCAYLLYCKQKIFIQKLWLPLSWLSIISAWLLIRFAVLSQSPEVPLFLILKSVFHNLPSLLIHLGKTILPFNLCPTPIVENTSLIFGIIVFFFVGFLIWATPTKRIKHIIFGILWFLLFLLPGLAISLTFYEYRMYIPLIGFLIVLMETNLVKKLVQQPKKLFIFTVITISLLFGTTFQYSNILKNSWNFWHAAVQGSPSLPTAHANLGRTYEMMGFKEAAKKSYFYALSLYPRLIRIHKNLGNLYAQEGDLKKAEREFLLEVKYNPSGDDIYVSFALLRYRQNRKKEARIFLNKALEINPDNLGAYLLFLYDYSREGKSRETEKYLNELKKRNISLPKRLLKLLS
ncbi:MAG: hypothetical protein P9M12_05675 [Candidatus Aceula lacicola]|nr:hypothetical protein [Candidatus Aceula lacicola]